MSQEILFVQLVKSLEQKEFDEISILYLKEVEGISNIVNCNGPWDSGLDIRSLNLSELQAQYQITIQEKNFEDKLNGDLEKAHNNVEEYGLPNKVFYFYSYPLSNTTILTYRRDAKERLNIILEIIEANALAEISTVYSNLRDFLFNAAEVYKYTNNSDFFDDPKVKSFYDLMSFGSSTDIKYNIIKSFLLNYLYTNGKKPEKELLTILNSHFQSQISITYFEVLCRRLKSEGKITLTGVKTIALTSDEKTRIDDVLQKYKVEEALLKKALSLLLKEFSVEIDVEELIIKLSELYESNYSINLGEFTHSEGAITDLKTATYSFSNYLKQKLTDSSKIELLSKRIFEISDRNEILSRISAGRVYSKVSDPDRLQEYICRHNQNKTIFLDTNVIINALCVYYEFDENYDKFHYKVANQLLRFCTKNNLHLKTIKSYVIETASIFKEALALIPFTKLKVFNDLGGSNNILYNYFQYLKDYSLLHEGTNSFEEFLKEFQIIIKKDKPDYNYYPQISHLLSQIDIDIEIPAHYDLGEVKELIEKDIRDNNYNKGPSAITNDSIMFMRLGDPEVDVNPMDPIFCTWDNSLFRVRKMFFEVFPGCTQWLMYSPTRLMDHYSMMNFQVKQGTLSNEVLSLLDKDFSFQERTHSLIDSILTVINPDNEVGLQYANKIAELRRSKIVQVDHKPDTSTDVGPVTHSVDIVFQCLFTNYFQNKDEFYFDAFKALFTKKDIFDDVFSLLKKEVNFVSKYGTISEKLFTNFDEMIEKSQNKV